MSRFFHSITPAGANQEVLPLPTTGSWQVLEEAVVGLSHRRANLPCQDAVRAVVQPHTALVVADGAGSSPLSDQGAQAVVTAVVRLLDTLDKPFFELLDSPEPPADNIARSWALVVVKHAVGVLKDIAAQQRRGVADFRSTLLLMVAGQERLLWLKVGDGAMVVEQYYATTATDPPVSMLKTLGEMGKGEFANQTTFLDAVTPEEVQSGLLDIAGISGMAVMSDGAAERLIANDGSQVATRVGQLLQQLREQKLSRSTLTQMFYEESFCKGTSGDDRSLALAAKAISSQTSPPTNEVTESASSEKPIPENTPVKKIPKRGRPPGSGKKSSRR